MIEAFANESETANIERPLIAALSAQRQRRETSSQRTSQTSHFSPTGKTEAGLFRLHQQHTHLNILERRLTFKRPTEQRNLPILFSCVGADQSSLKTRRRLFANSRNRRFLP